MSLARKCLFLGLNVGLWVFALMGGPAVRAEEQTAKARAIDFKLRDYRGKEFHLAETPEEKLVVVAFLGCECPLARTYGGELEKLSADYSSRGVAFFAINSNVQDSLAEMGQYARELSFSLPWLKDPDAVVADQFGATRTPEVFVLDPSRRIRYHGRIDDRFGIGFQRKTAQRRDLAVALDELLAGQEVSVSHREAVGCLIGRVEKSAAETSVTWSNSVAALFHRRCVECHREGEIGPFPLTSYEEARGWGPMIVEVTREGRMPPWFANPKYGHFANDSRLTDAEKKTIADWVAGGCPLGDTSQLPEFPPQVTGWRIGQPDQVIYIADQPVDVPAEGTVEYRYFSVDPGFTEDKWIKAAEARPGDRSVVHHILAFITPPGQKGDFRVRAGGIGYAPGLPPTKFPDGHAIFVPAGSKIVFQMHYTPNGTARKDRSALGLVFADPKTVKHKVVGGMAANLSIEIPPGASEFKAESEFKVRKDTYLLNLTPHMHLRGKAFQFVAVFPDGRSEVLLDVPRYDFNWQLRYELAEPRLIPAGTVLKCTGTYDNSAGNPHNPDPTQTVRWGDQTWEEMMIGWFVGVSAEGGKP